MCVKLKSQYLLNGSENAFKNTFWNALMYFRFFFLHIYLVNILKHLFGNVLWNIFQQALKNYLYIFFKLKCMANIQNVPNHIVTKCNGTLVGAVYKLNL